MAYPSIVGRRLDVPTINLGFSGSGRCEHGIVELLAELDPVLFVVDSVVNMEHEIVEERMADLLDVMRKRRPHARVLLMEEAVHPSVYSREKTLQTAKSATLQKVYDARKADWEGRLFLLRGDTLLSDDGEGTVDGIHPTDLGFQRMADAITPVVKRILAAADRV
jgi:lysophospholipase L1-like esterase